MQQDERKLLIAVAELLVAQSTILASAMMQHEITNVKDTLLEMRAVDQQELQPKQKGQQLADAFVAMADADHYMLGIVAEFSEDDLEVAEQILIERQNNAVGDQLVARVEKALDLIANQRRRMRLDP